MCALSSLSVAVNLEWEQQQDPASGTPRGRGVIYNGDNLVPLRKTAALLEFWLGSVRLRPLLQEQRRQTEAPLQLALSLGEDPHSQSVVAEKTRLAKSRSPDTYKWWKNSTCILCRSLCTKYVVTRFPTQETLTYFHF